MRLPRYRVTLRESAVYEVLVTATSPSEAEAKAERLREDDVDALTFVDGQLDWSDAILVDDRETGQ